MITRACSSARLATCGEMHGTGAYAEVNNANPAAGYALQIQNA